MCTKNFEMYKLDLEKAEDPEIKFPTSAGSEKSKGIPEKHLLHWSRRTVWMKLEPIIQSEVSQKEKHQYSTLTTKWKILKEMGIPDQRYLSSEKLYAVQKATS